MKRPHIPESDRWFMIHAPGSLTGSRLLIHLEKMKLCREIYKSIRSCLIKTQ